MGKPLRYPRETMPRRERPRRPCPKDFRERYLEMGWDGIQEYYAANTYAVARWIDECGGDELRAARAACVREKGRTVRTMGIGGLTDSRWYDQRSKRIPRHP